MNSPYRYLPAWGRSFEDLSDGINQLIKDGYSVLHIGGPVYNPDNGKWCQALWIWRPPEEPDEEVATVNVFPVKLEEPDEWELADMMQG